MENQVVQEQQREREKVEGMEVQCSSGLKAKRTKVIRIVLSAPKDLFSLTEALSRRGNYPHLEEFLARRARESLEEYLSQADEMVSRASSLAKSAPRKG